MNKINCRKLNIWATILSMWISTSFSYAKTPVSSEGIVTPNECKKIYKLSELHRQSLRNNIAAKNKESQALLDKFVLPGQENEEGDTLFPGIDINHDNHSDRIIRSCGSGVGRLCSLLMELSGSGDHISEEMGFFYLVKLGYKVVLIEEIDGKTSPYSQRDDTDFFLLSSEGIIPICNWK